ncbi:MAG: ATP-binding protein [Desulfosporosinus sp.]|nr:ATP-binding protein [Desulfosporosinus sp.]
MLHVLFIKNDEELERAHVMMSELLERYAPSQALRLEVAVNEAINNGFNSGGRVCVKIRRVGDKMIIRVRDDGPGFNTKEVNVELKKNIFIEKFEEIQESKGGRGILLMKLFCDRVIYNTKGNEVLLMNKLN